jgi:hypothetical protein
MLKCVATIVIHWLASLFDTDAEALPADSGMYGPNWNPSNRKPKRNRASLVAGLQPGVTEVAFHLGGCSQPQFTLLCKALEVQGPLVHSLNVEHTEVTGIVKSSIGSLMRAVARCSGLRELRWVFESNLS